ncbi:MAG: D-glycero-beta-D-manno-heptose-7-phosphate kinase [Deltaproteobacteria bacterium]|nr:D-glycero-beta-D-manno-heptose-7-phosphate kinase [Deltaproteobacteria bacterium]
MVRRLALSESQRSRLRGAVSSFKDLSVLVIGDLMLDTYIWGDVERISPEAPVPVVEVREETHLLGGSANVVRNLASLGARVAVTGTVGDDLPGQKLRELLEETGVKTDGLVVEEARPTTCKTRIIARNQQVVRCDRERRNPIGASALERVLSFVRNHVSHVMAIVVSDYAKGMITGDLMEGLRTIRSQNPLPIVVDPKVRATDLYRGVTLVTPNHHEASRMSGLEIRDGESLDHAGRLLLRKLECEMLLITRGKEGMRLFLKDEKTVDIPTVARRVYDVTGAGDTVLATVSLGLISGLSPVEAAILANVAAGIVVGEVGTVAVSPEQLLEIIAEGTSYRGDEHPLPLSLPSRMQEKLT